MTADLPAARHAYKKTAWWHYRWAVHTYLLFRHPISNSNCGKDVFQNMVPVANMFAGGSPAEATQGQH